MKVKISNIMKKGKVFLLAYDQGLEHGPTDFNDKNVDPNYILDIAKKGKFTGIILQKGIAEKYYKKSFGVPLILKLNGKTNLEQGEPIAYQLCSVKEAIKLGAKAVGYTIYVGSKYEAVMLKEFAKIEKEAHEKGLPVIAWMYPRGNAVKNEHAKYILAYSSRMGLELGADFVKMKYNGNVNDLKWIVKSAGKTKVLIAGGTKALTMSLFHETEEIMKAGASGLAIGRNVWQRNDPLAVSKVLREMIFNNLSYDKAIKEYRKCKK